MERHGGKVGNPWKRVSTKNQAGIIFILPAPIHYRDRKETHMLNGAFLGSVNPDKPISVRLGCFADVCMFTCPTSTGYGVLLTAAGRFEAILFAVKLWLSKPVPDDSNGEGGNKLTVCHCLGEHKGRQDFGSCHLFGSFNIWTAFLFKNSRSLKIYPSVRFCGLSFQRYIMQV